MTAFLYHLHKERSFPTGRLSFFRLYDNFTSLLVRPQQHAAHTRCIAGNAWGHGSTRVALFATFIASSRPSQHQGGVCNALLASAFWL